MLCCWRVLLQPSSPSAARAGAVSLSFVLWLMLSQKHPVKERFKAVWEIFRVKQIEVCFVGVLEFYSLDPPKITEI